MTSGGLAFTLFALVLASALFLSFKGNRQKADQDIEARLTAIEALVSDLTGDDLTRPEPRVIDIEGQRAPERPSALRVRG